MTEKVVIANAVKQSIIKEVDCHENSCEFSRNDKMADFAYFFARHCERAKRSEAIHKPFCILNKKYLATNLTSQNLAMF